MSLITSISLIFKNNLLNKENTDYSSSNNAKFYEEGGSSSYSPLGGYLGDDYSGGNEDTFTNSSSGSSQTPISWYGNSRPEENYDYNYFNDASESDEGGEFVITTPSPTEETNSSSSSSAMQDYNNGSASSYSGSPYGNFFTHSDFENTSNDHEEYGSPEDYYGYSSESEDGGGLPISTTNTPTEGHIPTKPITPVINEPPKADSVPTTTATTTTAGATVDNKTDSQKTPTTLEDYLKQTLGYTSKEDAQSAGKPYNKYDLMFYTNLYKHQPKTTTSGTSAVATNDKATQNTSTSVKTPTTPPPVVVKPTGTSGTTTATSTDLEAYLKEHLGYSSKEDAKAQGKTFDKYDLIFYTNLHNHAIKK